MSLLSRKKIHVGLCCGKCWLKAGQLHLERTTEIDMSVDGAALQEFFIQALSSMLDEAKIQLRQFGSIEVTVSDRIAMLTTLPWQETSMSSSEVESFAECCLARLGLKVDETHLLYADYPRYRSIGIVYALPKTFVESIATVIENAKLRLGQIMPVSASVFFSRQFDKNRSSTLIVCEESHCVCAWVFDGKGQLHYETEPMVDAKNQALKRMISRIEMRYKGLHTLDYWGVVGEKMEKELHKILPSIKHVNTVERERWVK